LWFILQQKNLPANLPVETADWLIAIATTVESVKADRIKDL
jgi:hypothetical protein